MSHAGLILGLPELEVDRVDRIESTPVYATPKRQPCYGLHPKVQIEPTYQRTLKHMRPGQSANG